MRWIAPIWIALLAALLDLAMPRLAAESAVAGTVREGIYNRAKTSFARAWLVKPEETEKEDLKHKLQPLFMQEDGLSGTTNDCCDSGFGSLVVREGRVRVDLANPVVYTHQDVCLVNGQARARLWYVWFSPQPHQVRAQGVRITLGSSGLPAVWEILNDKSGHAVVFVAHNLERAAAARFGAAVEGRRFSIEASMEVAPKTVVTRVLDDAPMPMGPIIYLGQSGDDVKTMICRCMPAQAKELAGTRVYRLLDWQTIAASAELAAALSAAPEYEFWPGVFDAGIEKKLRLPEKF